MLKLRNVTKIFGKEKVLDNCSFEVKKGMITALVGLNGSGKSTVFNLITGNLHLDSGKIFLDSENVTFIGMEKIANLGVSRLFQYPKLFPSLTVKHNLLLAIDNKDVNFFSNFLGLNKPTLKKELAIKNILATFQISDLENNLVSDLSFGQKRLVELARAILKPHKILLLDEPTYGIHFKIRNSISEVLTELKHQGDTIFLIEHDKNFVANIADSILHIELGKVEQKNLL